ncbi:hypothetical protein QBC37DRAFT_406663 [Rhypophila decipiens]|uniref:Uncharacterized protein n=1 Tax=Rhypophila decipiens TaxID=261697 RepID=A0AAN6XYP4_9PEZI|nr:hypothetical protein QBC37DRAFT_406663 [Rhypophila decipiens]
MENLDIYSRVPFNITWEGVPDIKYCLLVWTDADDPSSAYGILKSGVFPAIAKHNNPSTTTRTASTLSPPPVPSPNDPAMTVPIVIVGTVCGLMILMAIFLVFRLIRRRQKREEGSRGKEFAGDGHVTTMANKQDGLPELVGDQGRVELDSTSNNTAMVKVTEMEGFPIPSELESNAHSSNMPAMGQINELERTGHPSHLETGPSLTGEGLSGGGGQAMEPFPYTQPVYLVYGYDGTYQGYHYSSQNSPPDGYPSNGEPQAWMHRSDVS